MAHYPSPLYATKMILALVIFWLFFNSFLHFSYSSQCEKNLHRHIFLSVFGGESFTLIKLKQSIVSHLMVTENDESRRS